MPQAQAPNFSEILDRNPAEIERPKPLPIGTYTMLVKGMPRQDKSSKKGTPFVEFSLSPIAAGEDVDQEALQAWQEKADGSTRVLADAVIKDTYYLTEDALWRLKKFLTDLGIEEGNSLRTMIDQAPNRQILVTLRHEASQDGESVFARIATTAPAA